MRIFGRSRQPGDDPVAAFWAWWEAEGSRLVTRALEARKPKRIVEAMSAHVQAVAAGLAWELAAGTTSQHVLVVTAEGNPALRAAARRWLRAAPPPDDTWSYADFRLPTVGYETTALELAGSRIVLGDVRVATTPNGAALDVAVHHPALASLPPGVDVRVVFLALDNCLGEEVVETWIGRVEPSTARPPGAYPLARLPRAVEVHREEWVADGGPVWSVLGGESDRGPVTAMVRQPLRPTVAPLLDTHVGVAVPFAERADAGLPGPRSLEALRELEDHVTSRLGDAALLVAHETCDGVREWHLYAESGTPVPDQVRAAVVAWDEGPVQVTATHDPGWEAVAHLR